MKRGKQYSVTCGVLVSQQMARYSWKPPTLWRVSAEKPAPSSLFSGWNSMRGEHKPKHPEGGSGWEAAPHTHNHEAEYYLSFKEKAPLKLFVLSSEGRENLNLIVLTKF